MMISGVSFQKQVMLCFVGLQQGHGWTEGLTRHRARQDARPFFPLPVSPSPTLAQRFCRGWMGTGMEGGVRARGGGYSLMAPVYVGCVRSLGTFL